MAVLVVSLLAAITVALFTCAGVAASAQRRPRYVGRHRAPF
ncbi:UNVERIFIED_ORG: hypothetical protein CLV66_12197 [Actinomadura viridilutea]|nr:hypothetical protein [Actinomadura rubrobrunea]